MSIAAIVVLSIIGIILFLVLCELIGAVLAVGRASVVQSKLMERQAVALERIADAEERVATELEKKLFF